MCDYSDPNGDHCGRSWHGTQFPGKLLMFLLGVFPMNSAANVILGVLIVSCFFLFLPLNQPRFQICKKQHEEQSLQIGPKNFGYSATSGGQGCVSFYPSKVRGLLRLGADGVSVPGGTFGGQRSKCAAGAAGTSCQVSGSCATDERTGRFFHWEIREIVHLRLYFFLGGMTK